MATPIPPKMMTLRVQELEEGSGPNSITLGGQSKLLLSRRLVVLLDPDCLVRRQELKIRLAHVGAHLQLPRPHGFLGVLGRDRGLGDLQRPAELREQRHGDRDDRAEWLRRELEWEDVVLLDDVGSILIGDLEDAAV
jgi:hypothetical protein